MLQTISIIIKGKVQGVYYRQSTKEKAIELNISGVVKNLPDGNVYILASGNVKQLDEFLKWCWQGPRRARVTDVKHEVSIFQSFDTFRIEK